jgi:hypothetical protein
MATEEAVLLNLSEGMLSKLEKFIINNPAIAELTGKA